MRTIIQKAITTEKSFKNQDKGSWTFQVAPSANKIEIKKAIEAMFGVKVESVTTSAIRLKTRRLRGNRSHTRRAAGKMARITLKGDQALDLTKLNR